MKTKTTTTEIQLTKAQAKVWNNYTSLVDEIEKKTKKLDKILNSKTLEKPLLKAFEVSDEAGQEFWSGKLNKRKNTLTLQNYRRNIG